MEYTKKVYMSKGLAVFKVIRKDGTMAEEGTVWYGITTLFRSRDVQIKQQLKRANKIANNIIKVLYEKEYL